MRPLLILTFTTALTIAGCAALDPIFTAPEPGAATPAETTGQVVRTAAPPPWGELAMGAIMLIQNGYLLVRKLQRKLKR